MSRYRERNRAVWAAPRHHVRWGGDGPTTAVTAANDRLLINAGGDRLLINGSGDFLRIS